MALAEISIIFSQNPVTFGTSVVTYREGRIRLNAENGRFVRGRPGCALDL